MNTEADALRLAATLDWFDPEFRERTEFDVYERVRGLPPQRSERTGEWYFLGYEDCREAFQRADVMSNNWLIGDNPLGQSSVYPENADGVAQREYRRLLDPMFNPRRMQELEGEITAFAVQLLEPIAKSATTEFVSAFNMPFPTIIFCRLMGFPLEDHDRLMRWKDVYMNSMTPFIAKQLGITDVDANGRPSMEAIHAMVSSSAQEIIGYLSEILAEREARPCDDIISQLVTLRHDNGDLLDYDERIRICFNLFLGGLDTVTGMLSFIVRHFAEHPDDRHAFIALMDDPEKVDMAVEELVRFHSIVSIPRRVATACPFRGADLQENDIIQVVTPAANRDPRRFPNADRLDFGRTQNVHLGFGLGVHRCLGIHLARRELRIALQEMHRLIPDYSLDPDHPPVVGSGGVRGLFTLPLRIGA
ncbi:MAG: cytochrome P450 [Acidimicrobiia bacterium]